MKRLTRRSRSSSPVISLIFWKAASYVSTESSWLSFFFSASWASVNTNRSNLPWWSKTDLFKLFWKKKGSSRKDLLYSHPPFFCFWLTPWFTPTFFLSLTYPLIHTHLDSHPPVFCLWHTPWFTPTLIHTHISSVSDLPLDSHLTIFCLWPTPWFTATLIHTQISCLGPTPWFTPKFLLSPTYRLDSHPPCFTPKFLLSLAYLLIHTQIYSLWPTPWFTHTLIHTQISSVSDLPLDSHPPWFTPTLIHTHHDSHPPWFTPTFFLSPGNQLRVLLSFLSFDAHELLELAVMVNDPDQLLHLRVVLLHVLVCLLLQDDHLGLGVVPGNRATILLSTSSSLSSIHSTSSAASYSPGFFWYTV